MRSSCGVLEDRPALAADAVPSTFRAGDLYVVKWATVCVPLGHVCWLRFSFHEMDSYSAYKDIAANAFFVTIMEALFPTWSST